MSFCSLHFLGFAYTGGIFWVLLIQLHFWGFAYTGGTDTETDKRPQRLRQIRAADIGRQRDSDQATDTDTGTGTGRESVKERQLQRTERETSAGTRYIEGRKTKIDCGRDD